MADIETIAGKVLLDKKVFMSVLSFVEPEELDAGSTLFDVGYERAKADCLKIIGRSLGPEFSRSMATQLLIQLRNG